MPGDVGCCGRTLVGSFCRLLSQALSYIPKCMIEI